MSKIFSTFNKKSSKNIVKNFFNCLNNREKYGYLIQNSQIIKLSFNKHVKNCFCNINNTDIKDNVNKNKQNELKISGSETVTANKTLKMNHLEANNLDEKENNSVDNFNYKSKLDTNNTPLYKELTPKFNKDKGFVSFAYENAMNFAQKYIENGNKLFYNSEIKLEHVLDDSSINHYRDGIRLNNYNLYEKYINIPEFLFLGRSNCGKSSLLNALFGKTLSIASKKPGKTQKLEFYLLNRKNIKSTNLPEVAFFIDSPGYGEITGPKILHEKFKYLINTYLYHAVRLKLIFFLVDSEKGLEKEDWLKIRHLNNFGIDIALVFTKVDDIYNNTKMIANLKELSHLTRDFANVRSEIIMTSSKVGYGIENLKAYIENELGTYSAKNINSRSHKRELKRLQQKSDIESIRKIAS